METNVKPCPFCGRCGVDQDSAANNVWVKCRWCGACGPKLDGSGVGFAENQQRTIEAWDRRSNTKQLSLPEEA